MMGKAKGMKRTRKPAMSEEEKVRAWEFKLTILETPCAACGGDGPKLLGNGFVDAHHVVYQQHVRNHDGDLWAKSNALTLCHTCHGGQHGTKPVPLSALRDENYAFAYELLGPAAYDYLKRRYSGSDPRLDALLEERETDAA